MSQIAPPSTWGLEGVYTKANLKVTWPDSSRAQMSPADIMANFGRHADLLVQNKYQLLEIL